MVFDPLAVLKSPINRVYRVLILCFGKVLVKRPQTWGDAVHAVKRNPESAK